jgi:hypothetical protein
VAINGINMNEQAVNSKERMHELPYSYLFSIWHIPTPERVRRTAVLEGVLTALHTGIIELYSALRMPEDMLSAAYGVARHDGVG